MSLSTPISVQGSLRSRLSGHFWGIFPRRVTFSTPQVLGEKDQISEVTKSNLSEKGLNQKFMVDNAALVIETIARHPPLTPLSRRECDVLWQQRKIVRFRPEVLPSWWLSVPRRDRDAVAKARHFMARYWWHDTIASGGQSGRSALSTYTRIALECLSARHTDTFVRAYACRLLDELTNEPLVELLLQLTQALKLEPQHDSALARFLLRRAVCAPFSLGHRFFWILRAEMHTPGVAERYGVVLHTFLSCLNSDFRDRLEAECKLDTILADIAIRTKHESKKIARGNCTRRWLVAANHALEEFDIERRHRFLRRLGLCESVAATAQDTWDSIRGCSTSLNPMLRCVRIRVEQCKLLSSKKLPLYVVLENCDRRGNDFHIIFKDGDDLRQDQLTLQLLRLMDDLWRDAGFNLQMWTYGCIATGHKVGMIEVVPNATTTADIQVQYGGGAKGAFNDQVISAFLLQHNQDATQYERARCMFLKTCAGYCVATHVLGIGDRHADNIMVTKSGRLFHIDFGHFLGNFKSKYGVRRERSPFVFTPEMKRVIVHTPERISEQIRLLYEIQTIQGDATNHTPFCYNDFEHICCCAYNVVFPLDPCLNEA